MYCSDSESRALVGLVENEDLGVLEKDAGKRKALTLAAREPHPTVADVGVEAVGQLAHEAGAEAGLEGLGDLVGAGLALEP